MMPHEASDKDLANSQRCCHLLLKKGNPQGYVVTQTVATVAGFSRCNFLTQASMGACRDANRFEGMPGPTCKAGCGHVS